MNKSITMALAGALLCGCGGGGGSTPSPFAGTWSSPISGAVLSVTNSGRFTDSVADSEEGVDVYKGSVDSNGYLHGTATNSDLPTDVLSLTGSMVVTSPGVLTMNVTETFRGASMSWSDSFAIESSATKEMTKPAIGFGHLRSEVEGK